ncbi:MAG: FAD-dependent oxidoreductase, partial [Acidobacteriota bacterium]
MSVDSFDLLIVGGGIVGAACALEAVQAGLSVCVCERGVVGGG